MSYCHGFDVSFLSHEVLSDVTPCKATCTTASDRTCRGSLDVVPETVVNMVATESREDAISESLNF